MRLHPRSWAVRPGSRLHAPGSVASRAVTGPGWTLAALLGFAAAITPGAGLSWYRVSAEAAVFVAVLAAGYGLEWLVAARTGWQALRRDGEHAQDR